MTTNNPETDTPAPGGPATAEAMWELHRTVLNAFLWTMRNKHPSEINASYLDTLRRFLKDNGVTAPSQDARGLLAGLESLQRYTKFPFDLE